MDERRRSAGSWLSGARAAGADLGTPGERLGLPPQGSGAVAGYGRRVAGLLIDWLLAMLVAAILSAALHWSAPSRSIATLAVFGVMTWLLTGVTGTTVGKRLAGTRVTRVDGGRAAPVPLLARTALLLLVIPAVVLDRDYRGLHDRAAGTVVVLR